ncbi:hypothetical protein AB4254_08200 [Vibrio breoganii]
MPSINDVGKLTTHDISQKQMQVAVLMTLRRISMVYIAILGLLVISRLALVDSALSENIMALNYPVEFSLTIGEGISVSALILGIALMAYLSTTVHKSQHPSHSLTALHISYFFPLLFIFFVDDIQVEILILCLMAAGLVIQSLAMFVMVHKAAGGFYKTIDPTSGLIYYKPNCAYINNDQHAIACKIISSHSLLQYKASVFGLSRKFTLSEYQAILNYAKEKGIIIKNLQKAIL